MPELLKGRAWHGGLSHLPVPSPHLNCLQISKLTACWLVIPALCHLVWPRATPSWYQGSVTKDGFLAYWVVATNKEAGV